MLYLTIFLVTIANSFVGDEAAGDIFKSVMFEDFGSYIPEHIAAGHVIKPADAPPFVKINEQYRDELELGLHAPGLEVGSPTPPWEDDLDAFEEADTGDLFWGVDRWDVLNNAPGADGEPDGPSPIAPDGFAFFSLDALSPSIGLGTPPIPVYNQLGDVTVSSDDILVSGHLPGVGSFGVYANGVADIGLLPGDVLDALVLSDVGGPPHSPLFAKTPNGILDPGMDEALFSLQAGSPTLALKGWHPGDVLYTNFTGAMPILYADNLALGLDNDDELNALDIKPKVPEPSSILGLMALGILGAKSVFKRKLNQK